MKLKNNIFTGGLIHAILSLLQFSAVYADFELAPKKVVSDTFEVHLNVSK
jgi:hypothetical protein